MSKMLRAISSNGRDKDLSARVSSALGLTAKDEAWPERYVASRASLDHFIHGFAVSRGSDNDLVIYTHDGDVFHYFRAGRDGKAITALISNNATGDITMRAPAEAQAELDGEFSIWAAGIDNLLAGAGR